MAIDDDLRDLERLRVAEPDAAGQADELAAEMLELGQDYPGVPLGAALLRALARYWAGRAIDEGEPPGGASEAVRWCDDRAAQLAYRLVTESAAQR